MGIKHTFDPYKAIVYFDLVFEDYNYAEDLLNKDNDTDAAERLKIVDDLAPGDPGIGLSRLEFRALNDAEALVRQALPQARLSNEGHCGDGSLICKVGVFTIEDAKALAEVVRKGFGGGDDECYLDTPYFYTRDFRLYPAGVNLDFMPLVEINEAIEKGELE